MKKIIVIGIILILFTMNIYSENNKDFSLHVAIASGAIVEVTYNHYHAAVGIDIYGSESTPMAYVGYNSITPNLRKSSGYWKIRVGVIAIDRGNSSSFSTDTNTALIGISALYGYRFNFGKDGKFYIPLGIGAGLHIPIEEGGSVFVLAGDFGFGIAF